MFALTGDDFCINHFDGADTVEAARHAATIRHMPSGDLIHTAFSFTDRASIQAVIDSTFRLILSGASTATAPGWPSAPALSPSRTSTAVDSYDRSPGGSGPRTHCLHVNGSAQR